MTHVLFRRSECRSVRKGYAKIRQVGCDAYSDIEDGSALKAVAFIQPLKGLLPSKHLLNDVSEGSDPTHLISGSNTEHFACGFNGGCVEADVSFLTRYREMETLVCNHICPNGDFIKESGVLDSCVIGETPYEQRHRYIEVSIWMDALD